MSQNLIKSDVAGLGLLMMMVRKHLCNLHAFTHLSQHHGGISKSTVVSQARLASSCRYDMRSSEVLLQVPCRVKIRTFRQNLKPAGILFQSP